MLPCEQLVERRHKVWYPEVLDLCVLKVGLSDRGVHADCKRRHLSAPF